MEVERDYEKISQRLASIGIRFERWEAKAELPWFAGGTKRRWYPLKYSYECKASSKELCGKAF